MRITAIILSIIILTLSAIPCDDEGVFGSEQLSSISQNSDNDEQNTNDLCSPFNTCASCTGITLQPNIQHETLISEIPTKELSTYYVVSFSSNYLSLIYHPPQV